MIFSENRHPLFRIMLYIRSWAFRRMRVKVATIAPMSGTSLPKADAGLPQK